MVFFISFNLKKNLVKILKLKNYALFIPSEHLFILSERKDLCSVSCVFSMLFTPFSMNHGQYACWYNQGCIFIHFSAQWYLHLFMQEFWNLYMFSEYLFNFFFLFFSFLYFSPLIIEVIFLKEIKQTSEKKFLTILSVLCCFCLNFLCITSGITQD